MRLLLVGDGGAGSIALSLRRGLAENADLTFVDPIRGSGIDPTSGLGAIRLRRRGRTAGDLLVEAARQLAPDVVLIVQGRGIGPDAIEGVRSTGCAVAVYYPENPFWRTADWGSAPARLAAADIVAVTTDRIASLLGDRLRHQPAVVPLGYDDEQFPLTPPGTEGRGLAFVGSWSPRRERYLAALEGLPLTVEGRGWDRTHVRSTAPPPVPGAAVGVNLLHPRAAGGHNARSREIPASGAMLLTDPGTDGTPLVDGESCVWFHSPGDLRAKAEWALHNPQEAAVVAARGQALIAGDTWTDRARALLGVVGAVEARATHR